MLICNYSEFLSFSIYIISPDVLFLHNISQSGHGFGPYMYVNLDGQVCAHAAFMMLTLSPPILFGCKNKMQRNGAALAGQALSKVGLGSIGTKY